MRYQILCQNFDFLLSIPLISFSYHHDHHTKLVGWLVIIDEPESGICICFLGSLSPIFILFVCLYFWKWLISMMIIMMMMIIIKSNRIVKKAKNLYQFFFSIIHQPSSSLSLSQIIIETSRNCLLPEFAGCVFICNTHTMKMAFVTCVCLHQGKKTHWKLLIISRYKGYQRFSPPHNQKSKKPARITSE